MEQDLFINIIARALRDVKDYVDRQYIYDVKPEHTPYAYVDAYRYLLSEDCEEHCAYAGISYDYVEGILKLILSKKESKYDN